MIEGNTMIPCLKQSMVIISWCLVAFLCSLSNVAADESRPSGSPKQIEATIINVDKYAVYVPNLVFYWDPKMNKQQLAVLTRAAERLINKQATIHYSAFGDLTLDRRPLIVDIMPSRGPLQRTPAENPPKEPAQATPGNGSPPQLSPFVEEEPQTSRDIPPVQPAHRPVPEMESRVAATPGLRSISNAEVTGFIETYLAATEMKDVNRVLSYYADQVDYYSKGLVSKDYIRKDKIYYFRNWDRISCLVDGEIHLIDTDRADIKVAEFKSYFAVENSRRSISGRAENILKVQRINNHLQIIDEKQKVIGRELP
jgi:hypothetical protein